jgi:murein DD-endopeptidase MepM/ murein hydrolase activator NlpD
MEGNLQLGWCSKTHRRRIGLNRKGDLLMVFISLLFFAAILLVFWKLDAAFAQPNQDEGLGTRQVAVLHTYAVSEQMLLYLDEAAKYSAYESLAAVMEKNQQSARAKCTDRYANYASWTTPAKADCFPETKPTGNESIYEDFKRVMRSNLRSYMQFPGFPVGIDYTIDLDTRDGLLIRGFTEQKVTLPIVAVKDGTQNSITSILLQDNVAKATTAETADAAIDGIVFQPAVNRKPRTDKITHIIVRSTNTTSGTLSTSEFTEGDVGTHYFIDVDGKVTQFVPEAFKVSFLSACHAQQNICTIPNLEDKSISVAVQNKGALEYKGGDCPENYQLLNKKKWCGNTVCGDLGRQCWDKYTDAQLKSLEELLTEIAARDDIAVSNILFEEQVIPGDGNPGPALAKGDQGVWLPDMKTRIAAAKASHATEIVEDEPGQEAQQVGPSQVTDMDVRLPVDNAKITSCFGGRDVEGSTEHYGIDFGVPVGSNVYAVAKGEIVENYVCDQWQGECACSSRTGSCPLKCSKLCAGKGQGYGNAVLIKHDNGMYTYYTHLKTVLKSSGRVEKGDVIGLSGNTGSSTGPHLHFAIFPSPFKSLAKANGKNPLCIFPDEELKKMTTSSKNCGKYTKGFTHNDPTLAAECAGVPVGSSVPVCGQLNQQPLSASGNAEVDATLKAIAKQPELLEEIQKASAQQGIDYRLIIAQIARESSGRPSLVTYDGGVGIAQFTDLGVSRESFKAIGADISKIRTCKCPSGYTCTPVQASCDPGDPRLDPILSVRAQAYFTASLIKHYSSYTDKVQFGLAEYNWGPRTKSIGIAEAQKQTGKQDPSWSEVAPHSPAVTQKYVSYIMQYYVAQGGSTPAAFADMQCNDYNVKELGTYSFTPAFSVTVPNLLNTYERTVQFAKETYVLCDGRDGSTATCLEKRKDEFNRQSSDLQIAICEKEAQPAAIEELQQAISDCRANKQDNCACAWKPAKPAEELKITLDKKSAFAGSANTDEDSPVSNIEKQEKSLQFIINDKNTMVVADPDGSNEQKIVVNEFRMFKQGSDLIWITPQTPAELCGDYKTEHHICVEVKHPIPVLSRGTELQVPAIKFALYLNDTYVPEPVQNPLFVSFASLQTFTFASSVSDDASYYLFKCNEGDEVFINGRKDGKKIDGQFLVETCNGLPFLATQAYKLQVTPVDLSGNRGKTTACDTQAQQASQLVTGVGIPLSCI